jgi:phosphate transport system protein
MPRVTLDRQIKNIQDEILILGSQVEKAVLDAITVLKKRDLAAAKQIFSQDEVINEKPLAHDLRMLAAMLDVASELERMGDYAKGIAKVTQRMGEAEIPIPIRDIEKMAEQALSMLHRALGYFVEENVRQAASLPEEDTIVDKLYTQVYHTVVAAMIANPATIDTANLLLWVAHNLERLADRVTNICERTVFIATGEILEMDVDDSEEMD